MSDSSSFFTVGINYAIVFTLGSVGILYGLYNIYKIYQVKITSSSFSSGHDMHYLNESSHHEEHPLHAEISGAQVHAVVEIGKTINQGARAYLKSQSRYLFVFIFAMSLVIFFLVENKLGEFWSTAAFMVGAIVSIGSGYIGMLISVNANYRTTLSAANHGIHQAFVTAYRSGCVLSFCLVSLELLFLTFMIVIYAWLYPTNCDESERRRYIFASIAAFGLGGSSVALFCRVGGGIYTKAADVGADLVGKVEKELEEDSPKNPATIADNVGDNVGDIAGMGADLFGSLAEASCSVLLIAAGNSELTEFYSILYPLTIISFSILAGIIATAIGIKISKRIKNTDGVERNLAIQLLISSVIMTPLIYLAAYLHFPTEISGFASTPQHYSVAFWCPALGLYGGLIIGLITNYYTSYSYHPVQHLAESCRTGAATNIIQGLALGNLSAGVPVVIIAIISVVSSKLLGTYGISLGAIGMLSTLTVVLAVDGFGPVSDNAGGIAEMAELPHGVRSHTDDLDAAGNTTAAIGKGFAIGSAALVGLSLFGAFITRINEYSTQTSGSYTLCSGKVVMTNYSQLGELNLEIFNMPVYFGLFIGALLPYIFTALTMKSVGTAAWEMINEIRRQFKRNPNILKGDEKPDHNKCIQIATKSALREMILPGLLVMFITLINLFIQVVGSPFVLGFLFGPTIIFGLLPGSLVSGVCQAISMSNTGGAWDNCKKYIEKGLLVNEDGTKSKKKTDEHKAAVIGDTVGDPLKDTSGPSLNILIKLMAITSVVFAPFIAKTGYLLPWIQSQSPSTQSKHLIISFYRTFFFFNN